MGYLDSSRAKPIMPSSSNSSNNDSKNDAAVSSPKTEEECGQSVYMGKETKVDNVYVRTNSSNVFMMLRHAGKSRAYVLH